MPLGVDICEPPMLFALQAVGLEVRDGQQTMLDARQIKSMDEIVLRLLSACDASTKTVELHPEGRSYCVARAGGRIVDKHNERRRTCGVWGPVRRCR